MSHKEIKQFQDELRERGWDVEKTRSDHFKYTHRASGNFMFGASTPSDTRSIPNERSRAKKIEREYEGVPAGPKAEGERRERAKPRARVTGNGRVEYGIDPRDPWPELPVLFALEASLQNDSKTVKVVFPGDFVGHRFHILGVPYKRHLSITVDPLGHEIRAGYSADEAYAIVDSGFLTNLRERGRSRWDSRREGGDVPVGTMFDYLTTNHTKKEADLEPYRAPRPSVSKPTPITTNRTIEEETTMSALPATKTLTLVRNDEECDVALLTELIEGGAKYTALAEQLGYGSGQAVSNWIREGKMPLVAWKLLQLQERPGAKPATEEDRIRMAINTVNDAVRHKNMKLAVRQDGTLGATVVTEVSYG